MPDRNLVGTSRNYDWGVYNAISNGGNVAGTWRTLTGDEWDYLLRRRTTTGVVGGMGNALYMKAQVCGVNGMIIFPDIFTYPDGIPTASGVNNPSAEYHSTWLTMSEWTILESKGCVFLPAAGTRYGVDFSRTVGAEGYYWSSSYSEKCIYFSDTQAGTRGYGRTGAGYSVRLVRDIQ